MEIDLHFASTLLEWHKVQNKREMPWKGEKDPYKVWVSEVILQQTRVDYGIQYYERFVTEFPNVESLANAAETKVFKLWEGLGYYSRCKNLIASAKFIHEKLGGKFPDTYDSILELKGIGPYIASAIASFAYNLPYAVLDGNVFRVLSRFFGLEYPINSASGKKNFSEKATILLGSNPPAIYNQAIMDFGATVCKPFQPQCTECPLQVNCFAFKLNRVESLPVKEKSIKKRKRFFNFLIVEYKNQYYIKKRTEKDIWQNLHQFLLIETKSVLKKSLLVENEEFKRIFSSITYEIQSESTISKQILSHQIISGRFFHLKIKEPLRSLDNYQLISTRQLQSLAFPKFITAYLKD